MEAILHAVRDGNASTVQKLLRGRGMNARMKDRALVEAVYREQRAIVIILIKGGANVNAQDTTGGYTVLMHAVLNGPPNIVSGILVGGLSRYAMPHKLRIDMRDATGKTALMHAMWYTEDIRRGVQNIHMLLAYGAKVGAKDKALTTVGMHAVLGGVPAYIDILLEKLKNGKIDAKDANGLTALAYAVCEVHPHAVGIIDKLLIHGAAVNAKDKNGMTVLMHAAITGVPAYVDMLLRHGAPIDGRDKNGATALMHAIVHNQAPIVKLLREKGADITIRANS